MKNILLPAIIAVIIAICTSCGEKQKPSPRVSVWDEGKDSTELASLSSKKVIVPFERGSGDVARIQVSLNGEPFNMVWDTGASITCISALELLKLAKEDKIQLDDYQGAIALKIADGSTTESLIFNIREIYIPARDNQYLILHDIEASVSTNDDAPLLIGQNIIQNLPRHTFREDEGVIEFEQQ